MKHFVLVTTLSLLCVARSPAAEPPNAQEQQFLALVKEIQTQQAKLAENQAAIDAKLATVTEAVRQSRIYATRAGR